MTELVPKRELSIIGSEVRLLHRQAQRMTLAFGVEIGRRLVEAKQLVAYGEWGQWVETETEFSQTTATRLMKLFDEYGAAQIGIFGAEVESSTLQNLSVSNALRLIALPAEEREEFAEEHDVGNMSARELEKLLKERDEALQAKAAAEKALADAIKELDELDEERATLDEELHELKNRPIDVAVQEPDPAAVEAAAKAAADAAEADAKAHYEKELQNLRSKNEGLEKKRDKLEQAVKQAEEKARKAAEEAAKQAGADTEELKKAAQQAKAEAEELRKKLAMTDSVTPAFRVYFDAAQTNLTGAIELLGSASGELKSNLTNALRALLETFGKMLEGDDE